MNSQFEKALPLGYQCENKDSKNLIVHISIVPFVHLKGGDVMISYAVVITDCNLKIQEPRSGSRS